mmetsp:Transcript_42094/g.94887  ORF Transcript_42094/g.94887 Transcript_42094/m.94887 type:complete len:324 (+) Transcript_42094:519-1490(+)
MHGGLGLPRSQHEVLPVLQKSGDVLVVLEVPNNLQHRILPVWVETPGWLCRCGRRRRIGASRGGCRRCLRCGRGRSGCPGLLVRHKPWSLARNDRYLTLLGSHRLQRRCRLLLLLESPLVFPEIEDVAQDGPAMSGVATLVSASWVGLVLELSQFRHQEILHESLSIVIGVKSVTNGGQQLTGTVDPELLDVPCRRLQQLLKNLHDHLNRQQVTQVQVPNKLHVRQQPLLLVEHLLVERLGVPGKFLPLLCGGLDRPGHLLVLGLHNIQQDAVKRRGLLPLLVRGELGEPHVQSNDHVRIGRTVVSSVLGIPADRAPDDPDYH